MAASRGSYLAARCLSDDDAAELIGGDLLAAQRCAVVEHLDVCEPCRRRVSALLTAAEHVAPRPAAALPSDAGLRAGQVLGRFSLTRPLGHGAMGEVWAARDRGLRQLHADVVLIL